MECQSLQATVCFPQLHRLTTLAGVRLWVRVTPVRGARAAVLVTRLVDGGLVVTLLLTGGGFLFWRDISCVYVSSDMVTLPYYGKRDVSSGTLPGLQ